MDENPYRGPESSDGGKLLKRSKRFQAAFLQILVVVGILAILVAMLLPTVRISREAARRSQCNNNLKQIALALQNYADVNGALPPAYTTDADGRPLHSWRTLILPYLEEKQLYESIDLTKPWSDPANAAAFKSSLYAYQCPSEIKSGNRTTYLAVLAPDSCFRETEPRKLAEVTPSIKDTIGHGSGFGVRGAMDVAQRRR